MNTATPGKKVGLLFGSFNPIHTGHLILANYMATHTDLDAVWLVVSPQSPFKVGQELLPESQRYELVQLAIVGNSRLQALNIEFEMPKPSYTIDTLDELHRRHPAYRFVLLMGEDNLPGLPRWKHAERILNEHEVYVYPRPGVDITGVNAHPGVKVVDAPLLDISATFIRDCVREHKSIRYLVPDAVEARIEQGGFWR
ncbi:nicotinate-nucleotide adenylyltransferase [Hymenobacter taeanensis]|uniref:Probable nicotinate-nucleotide adenylyltransferase n=1 Tax=Hymenobacter taeanensis TaxID=2735321 RepID=A0A6M6BD72_9BACT|nr:MULTISPECIES: nicotinate (nicotinamide) nucleotide adenylyltransferase [Hymenobacter]QJX46166.1 nicotinate-nucleotide adenylyltransferase [Hymenobacter taeanensis]UOQ80022.1 nicotinate (nicotinamide) nucleotide adenylyltransferase [Hymenobacter sp. 5414T-23]